MKAAKYLSILLILIPFALYAQNPPSDFKLEATTGGVSPWSVSQSVTISANGITEFVKIKGHPHQILVDTSFSINSSNVQQIWTAVQNNNFFSLNSSYKDDSIKDGSFALFTITANGTTKQVLVKNTAQMEIQNIINSVNSNVPSQYNIFYEPSEKINLVPQEPCNSIYGSSFSIDKRNFSKANLDKALTKTKTMPLPATVQIPHAGVEIGYEESLYDAVGNGSAYLAGKGDFFGDVVSITGDYYNGFTPPDNTIHIKLNLEFYGPCDNSANEFKIVKDIYNKWNGVTTSGGKEIKIDIGFLSHPGASSPAGTPGFDDIKLACGNGVSYCDGLGKPNNGVIGGTWFPSDNETGTFGHEAGHLMGLDDQYDNWDKQPDGSWKSENDGSTLSGNDFVNLYNSKYGTNLNSNDFKHDKQLSIPRNNHENDLMADVSKPPLQSDIDDLAAQAGLIIDINSGDVLINTGDYEQNFVVTHSGNLFLHPGESRTLNGIYAACIDDSKGIPDSAIAFAVAPSLDKWNGINAALPLLRLVKYIDSLGYYCNYFDDYFAQEAIWRISDNVLPYDSTADSLLTAAGVNINQYFDFPRMTYNLSDSTSSQYIPDQLFAADIQPRYTDAKLNEKVDFTGSIFVPSAENFTTDFTWVFSSPDSNYNQLVTNGSSASITPLKRGVYSLNLNVTVKDSFGKERNFQPATTSYAVVADKYTETFEHNNLNDQFSWKTYGDAPWSITNTDAQTGNFSIKSGVVSGNQSSTLEITIDLPEDTTIEFGIKSKVGDYISLGEFYVDSLLEDYYMEYNDWTFKTYNLSAGKHVLKWIFQNYGSSSHGVGIWLDNIIFPVNATLYTSVKSPEKIPQIFQLFQNYPNPFNPSTEIKYSLAEHSFVKITLYDILGRKVKDLFTGEQNAGFHEIKFIGADLSSGVYIYSLEADYNKGIYKNVKKMILLK